jgi:Uma2 family endonuclease
MPVSEATYRRVALEDTDDSWELACGRLRKKPLMTTEHQEMARGILYPLIQQLDLREFVVSEHVKVRTSTGSYYIPDVTVVPRAQTRRLLEEPGTFEVYDDPVPLVVEVWSPSTGDYDVDDKFPEYRRRGDLEIWRLHPYDRTLTVWIRRKDGGYDERILLGGNVSPVHLPAVTINLDVLFGRDAS